MRTSVLTRPAAIAAVMAGACAFTIIHASEPAKSSITVVYNHEGAASAKGLTRRGGFSAHIDLMGRSVLFDTGGEASVILENLQSLGLGDAELEAVVISHNHWDHVYGLPGVMSSARNSLPRSWWQDQLPTTSNNNIRAPPLSQSKGQNRLPPIFG